MHIRPNSNEKPQKLVDGYADGLHYGIQGKPHQHNIISKKNVHAEKNEMGAVPHWMARLCVFA